jgi:hypothetical protein
MEAAMPSSEASTSYLTLGWKLDETGVVPKFKPAPLGTEADKYLVRAPADAMGCHTAIVAQSGSGKSFFLGRLIEELLLETKSRCVILDPNADFRRVRKVVDKSRWEAPVYDYANHRGFLPHEPSKDVFAQRWKSISTLVQGGPQFSTRLLLHWPSLAFEFLADDVEGMQRSDLYHCHEFVRAIAYLLEIKHVSPTQHAAAAAAPSAGIDKKNLTIDFIDEASRILRKAKRTDPQDIREFFEKEFDRNALAKNQDDDTKAEASGEADGTDKDTTDAEPPGENPAAPANAESQAGKINAAESKVARVAYEKPGFWYTTRRKIRPDDVAQVIDRAIAAVEFISDEVQRYYFGKVKEYVSQRIVRTRIGRHRKNDNRLTVIDLPSFPDQKTRLLALNSVLSTIWDRARSDWAEALEKSEKPDERVPTFIVVDEAHNLLPKETDKLAAKALLDQFRTIAAEGRKYGLFLILCTQRPDKIDELVISECENQAVMRLGSQSVLDLTTRLLGLEKVADKDRCLTFKQGRALLIGRWAKASPQLLYTAMRRTEEGGKNLRDEHWAVPYEEKSPTKADSENLPGPSKATAAADGPAKSMGAAG